MECAIDLGPRGRELADASCTYELPDYDDLLRFPGIRPTEQYGDRVNGQRLSKIRLVADIQ